MTEPADDPPRYRTGVLWVVLALLLTFGTVGAAFFVWGLTDLFTTGRLLFDLPAMIGGAILASYMLLLITGILYRIDRLRGVPHRRVELFE